MSEAVTFAATSARLTAVLTLHPTLKAATARSNLLKASHPPQNERHRWDLVRRAKLVSKRATFADTDLPCATRKSAAGPELPGQTCVTDAHISRRTGTLGSGADPQRVQSKPACASTE